jgi:hypothetical protein
MDKKYLLTYQDNKRGYGTFSWFSSEGEMDEFIETNESINVIERLHIVQAEEI